MLRRCASPRSGAGGGTAALGEATLGEPLFGHFLFVAMKFSFLVPLLLLVVGAAAATEGDDEGNFRSEGLFDDFEDNAMTAVQQLEKQLEEKTIQLQEAQSEIAKLQDNVKSLMQESERCKRKLMDCSWRVRLPFPAPPLCFTMPPDRCSFR